MNEIDKQIGLYLTKKTAPSTEEKENDEPVEYLPGALFNQPQSDE